MRLSYLLALALTLPAPALAQDNAPAADDAEILVVGSREQEKQRREQIEDFVRALSTDRWDSAMMRMEKACPGVIGLSPVQNLAIATRIRAVATAANITLADEGCQPNLRIVVVPDKDEMLQLLRKKHPILFRDSDDRPVEIVKEDGPVTAWHVREKLDRDGNSLEALNGVTIIETWGASSRVKALYRPVAMGSMILMEQKGLIGLTTTQIADYAAMRAFTTLYPQRLARLNVPTILHVMNSKVGDTTPPSLTQWDFAFLKSAYSVPAYSYASTQRSKIRRAIDKELKGEGREK